MTLMYLPEGMQPYDGDPPRRSRIRPFGQRHFRRTVDALHGIFAETAEERARRAMSGETTDEPHVVDRREYE